MILPEHKEAILQYNRDLNKKIRPILDEQRIEELVRTISVSVFTEKPIRILLFEVYEDREVIGRIDKAPIITFTRFFRCFGMFFYDRYSFEIKFDHFLV